MISIIIMILWEFGKKGGGGCGVWCHWSTGNIKIFSFAIDSNEIRLNWIIAFSIFEYTLNYTLSTIFTIVFFFSLLSFDSVNGFFCSVLWCRAVFHSTVWWRNEKKNRFHDICLVPVVRSMRRKRIASKWMCFYLSFTKRVTFLRVFLSCCVCVCMANTTKFIEL